MHEIVLGGRCSSGGNPVALALAGKTAICVPMATAAPRTSPPAAETRLLLALLPVGGKGLGLDSSFMMGEGDDSSATTHDTIGQIYGIRFTARRRASPRVYGGAWNQGMEVGVIFGWAKREGAVLANIPMMNGK